MLGTPFQFGKPIQFRSDTSGNVPVARYKHPSQYDVRRMEASRPFAEYQSGRIAANYGANLYSTSGHRLPASANSVLAHGWLTYAPVTIVPNATSKAATGGCMSLALRQRYTETQPSLERVLPATYNNAKVRDSAAESDPRARSAAVTCEALVHMRAWECAHAHALVLLRTCIAVVSKLPATITAA
jgi:hypothetical protein